MSNIGTLNYLAVGKNGEYSQEGKYRSSPAQAVQITQHIANQDIQELNIYFHGGLVSESSAEDSIQRVFSALEARGVEKSHNLAFIWKTDLVTTLKDNITDIFGSKFGKSLLKWVIRAVSKKIKIDSVKSGGTGAGLSLEEIEEAMREAELNGTPILSGLSVDFVSKAKGSGYTIDEDDSELIAQLNAEIMQAYQNELEPLESWGELPNEVAYEPELAETFQTHEQKVKGAKGVFSSVKIAKAVVKIASRVIKRYMKDTDHGLHATVVEEICRAYFLTDLGQWVWGEMKDKASEMWHQDSRVGFDFILELQQSSPNLTINLIGHSAGSICISELMKYKRAKGWNLTVNKIVWWAPACTCQLFHDEIIAKSGDFSEFRMYTMQDHFERDDNLINMDALAWLYPSSLLYFISGVLEPEADYPIAGMTRFQGAQSPYDGALFKKIKNFLNQDGRLVLSKTDSDAPVGLRSQAIDHGAFNSDEETLKSLTEYL